VTEDFDTGHRRDLLEKPIPCVLMDGWYPNMRIGKRRFRVPVLVTLGVGWTASAWRSTHDSAAAKALAHGVTSFATSSMGVRARPGSR
jgi:hypothetical protein